jgi:uncharacterized protein (TIRG00374 family)
MPPKRRSPLVYALQFLLGVFLFAGLLYISGINLSTLDLLQDLHTGSLLAAFALTILLTFFISFRWNLIVNTLAGSKVISQSESYLYVLLGRTIGFILPKDFSDIAARTLLLSRRNNLSIHLSTNSLILDKLLDLIVSAVFLAPSILYVIGRATIAQSLALLAIFIVLAFVLLFFFGVYVFRFIFSTYNFMISFLLRLLGRKFKPIRPENIPSRTIGYGYIASVAKQFSIGLRALFLGQAVGINISALPFLFGASISQMSYVVAVTPDGLGVFDAAWYAVLLTLGISQDQIGVFLVTQRVFTILSISAMTLLMLAIIFLFRDKEAKKA